MIAVVHFEELTLAARAEVVGILSALPALALFGLRRVRYLRRELTALRDLQGQLHAQDG